MSKDPRAEFEHDLDELASELRDHPTVPANAAKPSLPMEEAFHDDVAPLLPQKHCAFKNCTWCLEWGSPDTATEHKREKKLLEHVTSAHGQKITPLADKLPQCHDSEERIAAVYNEAIGIKVRQGAPLASFAIDRKCVRRASLARDGDKVEASICFFCACIHPHMEGNRNQHIKWTRPLDPRDNGCFFKYSYKVTESEHAPGQLRQRH
jgi:hypothetical protein